MSILSKWFKQESTKVIMKSALAILKALAFGVGKHLWDIALTEVQRVDALPISGKDKARMVGESLRRAFPGAKDYLVNLAIELAVAHVKESLIKK